MIPQSKWHRERLSGCASSPSLSPLLRLHHRSLPHCLRQVTFLSRGCLRRVPLPCLDWHAQLHKPVPRAWPSQKIRSISSGLPRCFQSRTCRLVKLRYLAVRKPPCHLHLDHVIRTLAITPASREIGVTGRFDTHTVGLGFAIPSDTGSNNTVPHDTVSLTLRVDPWFRICVSSSPWLISINEGRSPS